MATGRAAAGVAGSCRDRLGGYRWYLLNDNVIGGQSTSQVDPFEVDGISFSGVINTDGGGFVSTRTDASSKIISIPDSATMIKVEVRGDGQLYKILLPRSYFPTYINPHVLMVFSLIHNDEIKQMLGLLCLQK